MIEYEYHIIDVDDRVKNDMLCSVKVSKVKNTEVNCSNIVCSNDELCIFRGSNSLLSMWFVVVAGNLQYYLCWKGKVWKAEIIVFDMSKYEKLLMSTYESMTMHVCMIELYKLLFVWFDCIYVYFYVVWVGMGKEKLSRNAVIMKVKVEKVKHIHQLKYAYILVFPVRLISCNR